MKQRIFTILCMVCLSVTTMAQGNYTVRGEVHDETGQPIIGATVIQKGTSHATVSDVDGKFALSVPSASTPIVISFLGYKSEEHEAGSPIFNAPLQLAVDAQTISNVVVVGYGTLRKSDMTGSVAVVKSDLESLGATTSASDLLLGKVPGLQITPGNGQPGAGTSIRIRGGASLNASNNPLVVIDGVPVAENAGSGMSNPLAVVNPNDIASMTVLKDASSTAIYGSRGSNGVIIITTKKGSTYSPSGVGSDFRLSYNSNYSVNVNSKEVPTLKADEFREFMNTYWSTNAEAMATVGTASTDWQKEIFRPAFATDQFLSGSGNVSGKHNSLGYRISAGYTGEDGTLKNSHFDRYTASVNLSPRFLDNHLSIDVNVKGTITDERKVDQGVIGGAAFFNPTLPIYKDYPDNKYNGYYTIESNTLAPQNPLAILNDQYDHARSMRSIGNIQIDYKMHFLPELRANLNLGYDITASEGRNGVNVNSSQAWRDGDYPGIGRYNNWSNLRRNQLLDFYLNYAKDINKNRVDVMLGYSWQHFYSDNHNTQFPNNAPNEDNPVYQRSDATENYLVSFFGRANYSYDNRFLVTATVRYDGSSRFSKNNRWGLFPSVALGWNLAQESWLKGSAVGNLKLRASWGITGQQELSNDYPYLANYDISNQYSQYQFGNTFFPLLKPLAYDENIRWEQTETYNIGLDFGAWDNRLTASVDLYQKYTKDLLNTISVPAGSNFSNQVLTNIGNLENKGIEISIAGDIIRTKDWNWNLGLNATVNSTKITKLTATDDPNYLGIQFGSISAGTSTNAMIHAVGHTPNSFYVYQQAYDAAGNPMQNVMVDRNQDGMINDADRYVFQSSTPKMYFGISTALSFRNWDLAINAHGSLGNYLYNDFRGAHSTTRDAYNAPGFSTNVTNFYKETGFTKSNQVQQNLSDYWVEDASFLRLDNVTLGYNFQNLFKCERLNGRLSFTAQNLFVVTNYSGMDPENSRGIDGVIWPRPRTFILGLTLNF